MKVLAVIIALVIGIIVAVALIYTLDLIKGVLGFYDDDNDGNSNNSGGSTDYIVMTGLM